MALAVSSHSVITFQHYIFASNSCFLCHDKRIFNGYTSDKWWSNVHKKVLDNKKLGLDKALLSFVLAEAQLSDSDPYFQPTPEPTKNMTLKSNFISSLETHSGGVGPNTSRLIFHLNCLIGVRHFYIPLSMASKLLAIVHGKRHSSFLHCHKIIFQS